MQNWEISWGLMPRERTASSRWLLGEGELVSTRDEPLTVYLIILFNKSG